MHLSLNNLPKATELVNDKAGWNLVSLVMQKFLLRNLFQLSVDGLASSKAHSPSSKEKKEGGKGRGGWAEKFSSLGVWFWGLLGSWDCSHSTGLWKYPWGYGTLGEKDPQERAA